jgi:putative SOS response-associated peptidase YedK
MPSRSIRVVDQFLAGNRTGPAPVVGEPGAVIRRGRDGIEMVNLAWGLAPRERGGRPLAALRAEGRRFPTHRCLVPASEFFASTGKGEQRRRWRFSLSNGDFFYFAGIWRPGTEHWPAAYAVLTVPANLDVLPYRARQMAVIRRADRMAWLNFTRSEEQLLKPLPHKSFRVDLEGGPPAETPAFAWRPAHA